MNMEAHLLRTLREKSINSDRELILFVSRKMERYISVYIYEFLDISDSCVTPIQLNLSFPQWKDTFLIKHF